jgi:hypothetical protein
MTDSRSASPITDIPPLKQLKIKIFLKSLQGHCKTATLSKRQVVKELRRQTEKSSRPIDA